ncbi:hypothetical protein [Streptomyces sp. TLI_105]|uniref:hypothetical protein n=1 Tax=Streptomyces sp. TLI_105 TaxID=1881019 RepID=UPI00089A46D0|nr:hypothetical protein [Streptomyces sp. TLI_105]SEC23197.1 hypothetical protein SAMN05428939_1874 [Streptomyces sp. TLI_105]
MTRTENEADQIVFRWDSENLTGNTGFGPVAWSGPRDETENLFQLSGPVLRPGGDETRPALIRLRRRDHVMLIRRTPFTDADGRTSVLCHALVGAPTLLAPAVCLGLHGWDWDGAAAANAAEARGPLPVVPAEALVPAASRGGLTELDRLLPYAAEELVGAVAEFLRHPDDLFTVLDERGDTACPVLWGLHSMLGALTKRPWTFATHDTAELPSLRFVFVGRWSGAASRNTERRRVDPRERCGDRAEEVAARLVRHHLWEVEEGKGRDRVIGRALRTAAATYRGPLLETASRAADRLDAVDPRTSASRRRNPLPPEPEDRDRGTPTPWAGDGPGSGYGGGGRRDRTAPHPRYEDARDPRDEDAPGVGYGGRGEQTPPGSWDGGARDAGYGGAGGRREQTPPDSRDEGVRGAGYGGRQDLNAPGTQDQGAPAPRDGGLAGPRYEEAGGRRDQAAADPRGQGFPASREQGSPGDREPDSPGPRHPGPSAPRRPDPVSGGYSDLSGSQYRAVPGPGPAVRPDGTGRVERSVPPDRRPDPDDGRGASWAPDGHVPEPSSDPGRAPAYTPEPPLPPAPPSAPAPPRPAGEPRPVAYPRPVLPVVGPQWTGPGKGARRRPRGREAETSLVHKLPTVRSVEEARELVVKGGSRELLDALRRPQAYAVVTVLLREIAQRLPSWGHPMRRELCEVAIARELWAVPPPTAREDPSEPPEEQRAANAAELHRWAVRPLLGGGDAPVGTVAELLSRLRTSPEPSAREAFWLIVDGESPGLPDAVWLTLLKEAYGLPRTAPRPAPPSPALADPDDPGNGYTRRFLRRAAFLIGGLVVAIVLIGVAQWVT